MVTPAIAKTETTMRKTISAEERLAVTLRFLATGNTYFDLAFQFRMHQSTISGIIPEVCQAIYQCLKCEYLRVPNTKEEWKEIADETEKRWQFPNCFGAADGKHIPILHPKNSGSDYYNYKGFFSIVLLAIVDFDYKFLFVDVGCQGRISDGGVYRNSAFYKAIENKSLNLPDPLPLPKSENPRWMFNQSDEAIPYVFVADDAFLLGKHCMKPFPQSNLSDRKRIFNYRLSRMRRISENFFEIWGKTFRVFTTTMALEPKKAVDITLATIALHNMLRIKSKEKYMADGLLDVENEDGDLISGRWRFDAVDFGVSLQKSKSNRASTSAEHTRNLLADHFYGLGEIPWQWKVLV